MSRFSVYTGSTAMSSLLRNQLDSSYFDLEVESLSNERCSFELLGRLSNLLSSVEPPGLIKPVSLPFCGKL